MRRSSHTPSSLLKELIRRAAARNAEHRFLHIAPRSHGDKQYGEGGRVQTVVLKWTEQAQNFHRTPASVTLPSTGRLPRYFDLSRSPIPIAGWNALSIPREARENQFGNEPRGIPLAITPLWQQASPASRTYLMMDLILPRKSARTPSMRAGANRGFEVSRLVPT